VLTDGTQIAATALSTTDADVKLSRAAGELTIPLAQVAWLVFNPVTRKAIQHASGKPGALLPTGDVYEGEFAGIKDGKAIVNSIILGPSSFPIETGVVAIALRPVSAASGVSSIRTIDGTKWVGSKLAFEKDAITIQTKSHGVQRIASADVVAIDAP
jgi:hypothetical protein